MVRLASEPKQAKHKASWSSREHRLTTFSQCTAQARRSRATIFLPILNNNSHKLLLVRPPPVGRLKQPWQEIRQMLETPTIGKFRYRISPFESLHVILLHWSIVFEVWTHWTKLLDGSTNQRPGLGVRDVTRLYSPRSCCFND